MVSYKNNIECVKKEKPSHGELDTASPRLWLNDSNKEGKGEEKKSFFCEIKY